MHAARVCTISTRCVRRRWRRQQNTGIEAIRPRRRHAVIKRHIVLVTSQTNFARSSAAGKKKKTNILQIKIITKCFLFFDTRSRNHNAWGHDCTENTSGTSSGIFTFSCNSVRIKHQTSRFELFTYVVSFLTVLFKYLFSRETKDHLFNVT